MPMDYPMEIETTTTAAAATETATMLPTTTTMVPPTTTTVATELYAKFIAAPASSLSPEAIAKHMQQNQITFEIPTARDLRHIDAIHSFNALLKRVVASNSDNSDSSSASSSIAGISTEQLSKSVVLDLADLRNEQQQQQQQESSISSSASSFGSSLWEEIFGNASADGITNANLNDDENIHEIINYLWIAVVTSLLILSIIFILFSCYFYRKFRTWKKCNKDIRAQIHHHGSDSTSYSSHSGAAASHLLPTAAMMSGVGGAEVGDAAFYQIESPPCYTIATGLPTYDEALHHHHHHHHQHQHHQHHQHQYQHSGASTMKLLPSPSLPLFAPTLAAVHHNHRHHYHHHNHQQHHQQHHQLCVSNNWEKDEKQKLQKCKLPVASNDPITTQATTTGKSTMATLVTVEAASSPSPSSPSSATATNGIMNLVGTKQQQQQQQQMSLIPAAPADDDCASLVVVVAA